LSEIETNWNALGEQDPLWAILYDSTRKGNRWEPEAFFATGRKRIAEVMTELADLGVTPASTRALDFGCGVGRLTQPLASYFDRVDGVDIARSMIEGAVAYNKCPDRCFYHHNSAENLSLFDDATFDFVYTEIVLQHIPPDLAFAFIREFIRVLRPGGIAVFDLPSGYARSVRGQVFRMVPAPLLRLYRRRVHGDGTMELHVTKPAEVRSLLEREGVTMIDDYDVPEVADAVIRSRQYIVERPPPS